MAVELEISDGTPWFLSTDIWTVPGDDPLGPAGLPRTGEPCYLWARVHNKGTDAVQDAQVHFYWANPSVGFDRTTAQGVGSANVTLDPGMASEVLCLTPWVPAYVNGGHECILAEAFHPQADPLPPSVAFDVPTDRHVAQRNLSVIHAGADGMFHLAFEVHNPGRKPRTFQLNTEPGKSVDQVARHMPDMLARIGKKPPGQVEAVSFTHEICPAPGRGDGKPAPPIRLPAGQRQGLTVTGRLRGAWALLHVVQQATDTSGRATPVGGLAILVLDPSVTTPR